MVHAMMVTQSKKRPVNKMQEGQIIEIVSNLYTVSIEFGKYKCRIRGVFRNRHITPTVGDYCLFSKDKLLIEEILFSF